MVGQFGGDAFALCQQKCLESLQAAIQFPMSGKVSGKSSKKIQFHHARDNAIASFGKILKYQKQFMMQSNMAMYQQLVGTWLSLLPITHDAEEAQLQYEFVAEMILQET